MLLKYLLSSSLTLQCIQDLHQSPWLFPFENLHFEGDLGSGAFGVVKKARAHSIEPNKPSTTVAVKMLKGNGYTYTFFVASFPVKQ